MMMTISNTQPSFVMAMLDTVFACLEGFFVFMVFFTDPALTAFIDDRIQYWRKVYVEEYRLVEIRNDESTDQEKKDEKSHTLYIMPPLDPPRETEWNAAIIHASATSRYSGTNHNSVPMRRIAIPPSSLEQLSSHYNIRQLSFCTLPTTSDTIETTQADNPPQFIPPPPPSQPPVSSDSLPPSLQQHQQQPQQIDASSTTHLTNNCYNNQFPSQESIIHVVFIPYKSALWARICNHFLSRYGLALFTPVSSRSVPRSSSTIELRSYAHPVNGNNDTINDLPANNYEASNDNEQEQKHRYKFSMADQTRHY
ncbi:hypothetical protein BCR42DRAFT_66077 [Absidia repens]|uniref:Uncharacterized protein n=1 Tax=Absidia repens TaxID=90262 RepID=A0A1X2IBU3_9FUNG|nr:hypothetical protein BCR42DRAFT_66077 [Absidia repens]